MQMPKSVDRQLSQLAVTESASLGPVAYTKGLQLSIPGREAEEVLSGVFKITQSAMDKRSYGSI